MFGRRERYYKDPDDVLDYLWDWSNRLTTSEAITASIFIVTPGITVDSSSHDDTTATVWLSGGTSGENYRITNRIDTDQGRQFDWSITMIVRPR